VSDVHSNLEALEAAVDEIGKRRIYCVGDIVGYGASPNEVIALLQKLGATCVLGNHDYAAMTRDVGDFNARAAVAATWTADHLTPESREFLGSLPKDMSTQIGGKKVYMAHGSPDDQLWEYVHPSTHSDLFDYYLDRVGADIIAFGHTHMPFEWRSEAGGLVFNPGSVGQPRNGDIKANFAILTVEGDRVMLEPRRVEYDAERAARKIIESGLPSSLATQLLAGE
jgi:putative phosphoesterase